MSKPVLDHAPQRLRASRLRLLIAVLPADCAHVDSATASEPDGSQQALRRAEGVSCADARDMTLPRAKPAPASTCRRPPTQFESSALTSGPARTKSFEIVHLPVRVLLSPLVPTAHLTKLARAVGGVSTRVPAQSRVHRQNKRVLRMYQPPWGCCILALPLHHHALKVYSERNCQAHPQSARTFLFQLSHE